MHSGLLGLRYQKWVLFRPFVVFRQTGCLIGTSHRFLIVIRYVAYLISNVKIKVPKIDT